MSQATAVGSAPKTDRSFGSILTTVLSWNLSGAILAILFEAIFRGDLPPAQIAYNFFDAFIYANCIGLIVGFAIFTFTPRLTLYRFPLNWVLLISMILSLTFVGSLIAGFTLMGLGIFPPQDYGWISLRRMGFGFLLVLVFGISGYLYESVRLRLKDTTQELRQRELEGERARKLAVEACLSSLESRIQPHFLFNTLNSIASLIQEDPLLAERTVERLAALLRFSLDSSHRSLVPLEHELRIALDYLEIEKARFGERLQYHVNVPHSLHAVLVPPFIIQTLVENSVKHAVSVKREGGEIRLKAYLTSDLMKIEVWDDGDGFVPEAMKSGHGLDNLRARLANLFGDEADLEILRKESFTVVSFTLPNERAQTECI